MRLTSGKLLPEDRSLWYSSSTRPLELLDYDRDEPHVHLNQQYQYDRDWFKVDTYSLVIEGVHNDTPSSSSRWISSTAEEPLRVTEKCHATLYKSLMPRIVSDHEFVFDFTDSYVCISDTIDPTSNNVKPVSLANLYSIIPFPHRILGDMYTEFRTLAREARRVKFLEEEEAIKKELEEQLIRKKQQVEIQQKQKDLVQLALKRAAQNRKPQTANVVSTPPMQPVVMPSAPMWSVPPQPVLPHLMMPPAGLVMQPMMIPPNPWSTNPRPMIPPPMPMQWHGPPMHLHHPMVPPPHLAAQPVDPWSSAAAVAATSAAPVRNPWAATDSSEAKRPKVDEPKEDDSTDKQRMARLGVPFK